MTNIPNDIKEAIDERVQGRDIEKAFDYFVEVVTDTMMDEIRFPIENEDASTDVIDYMIAATMRQFHYHFVPPGIEIVAPSTVDSLAEVVIANVDEDDKSHTHQIAGVIGNLAQYLADYAD